MGKWVLCSERMPEVIDDYLVTIAERWSPKDTWEYHTDVALATLWGEGYIDGFWNTWNDWDEGQEVHVVAWMPLPKPWTNDEVSDNMSCREWRGEDEE